MSDPAPKAEHHWRPFVGLGLAVAASVLPVWLTYQFSYNYDYWFGGYGFFLDPSAVTALIMLLFFLPLEAMMLVPAFILSRMGLRRSKTGSPLVRRVSIAGLAVVAVAAVAAVALTVFAWGVA